jgi:hypothetical protein
MVTTRIQEPIRYPHSQCADDIQSKVLGPIGHVADAICPWFPGEFGIQDTKECGDGVSNKWFIEDECAHGKGVCYRAPKLPMPDSIGCGEDVWDGDALGNALSDLVEIGLRFTC